MLYLFFREISSLSIKIWICSFFIFTSSSRTPPKSNQWGFYGHKKINELAVFTLPSELIGFYKEHIDYLKESSVLPDKRRYILESEGPKHFIDLDHYQIDSLSVAQWVPAYWKDAKEKFSRDTLNEYGILPWNIQWVMRKLEEAFKKKNSYKILKYSAELGHYVSDAHVPLHTTENYNGQLTNQHGIHSLWESRLVEIHFEEYDFFVGKAKYIERPLMSTWEIIFKSHSLLPEVLVLEKVATDSLGVQKKYGFEKKGDYIRKVYSHQFSELYHMLMNGMVQNRMRKSVLAVGSFWFTAWVNAGQPDLKNMDVNKIKLFHETKDSLKTYDQKLLNIHRTHDH